MDHRIHSILSCYGGEPDGAGIRIPCPVHNGKDNNCSVWIDDKDKLAAHCHSHQCDVNKVLWDQFQPITRGRVTKEQKQSARWLRDEVADVFEPPRTFKSSARADKSYDYTSQYLYQNSDGVPINVFVVRYDNLLEKGDKVTIPYIWAGLDDGRKMWIARGPNEPVWYGLQTLHNDTVLIVEGEKTANHVLPIVKDKMGVLTWLGGSGKYKELNLAPLEGKKVILWPDNDEPGFKWAYKGENNLYDSLKKLGCDVSLVMWDAAGPGCDGADAENAEQIWSILQTAQSADQLRLQIIYNECLISSDMDMTEEIARTIPCGVAEKCKKCQYNYIPRFEHPLDILNKDPVMHDYVYITSEEVFVNLRTMQVLNRSGFDTSHAALPGYGMAAGQLASRQFWESPGTLKVHEREFRPGQALMIDGKLNLAKELTWTNYGRNPDRWMELGEHLFRKDEFQHILDWLAFTIQRPETKINHTLLICGGQGVGKSLFFSPIERALNRVGQHQVVDSGMLNSQFNDYLVGTKLLTMEELNLASGGYSISNKLKPYQATPPDYLSINPKFNRPFQIPNVLNLIAYSNYDLPIKLEQEQRRWYVVRSTAEKLDQQEWYTYEKFNEMLGDEYVDRILSYLDRRELYHFNPYGNPPHTEAALEMELHSIPGYREYAPDIRENEFGDLTDLHTVRRYLEANGHRTVSDTQLRKILHALGWTNLETQIRVTGGRKVRPWATRRGEMYKQTTTADLIRLWSDVRRGEAVG